MGDFKLSASLRGHEDDVRSVAFPHPTTVVSASRDFTVRLWKQEKASPPAYDCTIKTHGKEFVNSLAVVRPSAEYPEGLIVSGGKDTIIDVRRPSKALDDNADALLLGHASNVCALDASEDGKLIISGSWDADARVWTVGKWETSTVLQGHTASVWAVLAYDGSTIITGCADQKIRIFEAGGKLVRSIQTGDVVRALCRLPPNHPSGAQFASAGNDAVVRLWTLSGRQVKELHGHENFIYSLAAFPDGRLVSAGEDRTVRIWDSEKCLQTITHPAISVWTVAVCSENGDIVTGASDRLVRIFTRASERYAAPEAIEQFNDDVKGSAIPQQAVGSINKEKLPGPEFLTQKSGTKEGQVQMILEANGNIAAYQWSTAGNAWVNVGTVVDQAGSSGRKISHNGKEYDYVFDVDIEDGKPPLKLPYNASQNPYEVAQKFCADNKLPVTYLDQVTNFIVSNTQGSTLGQSASYDNAGDAWGTGSRYRPGDADQSTPQPPVSKPSVLPQKTYLDITSANYKIIFKKLQEFNQGLVDQGRKDLSLNPTDIEELGSIVTTMEKGDVKKLDPAGIDLIVKAATAWPVDKRLPGLDLLRCLAAFGGPALSYLNESGQPIVETLGASGVFENTSPTNNTMMAVRALGNLFKTEDGRATAINNFDQINVFLSAFLNSTNRNLLIAITTVYINYSVLLSSDNNADRALTVLDSLSKILSTAVDSEAVYRALVAMGTILCLGSEYCEAGKDVFQIGTSIARASDKVKEPRISNVVAEIRAKLKD
ncbi:polyubiquitin binding protein-like protein [Amniculicola lignicola CBS 123094]|uniref:Polyubiquitin binding protein-like protein n=1 Tax=Amniculicola lignicola CBS 123094 TaxID=1392246 RepID=A0A6A5VY33_9PLEO|nr:polyubiquitin binding protein-like protein [Amniculicola lignicola CBS 123094]